MDVLVVGLGLLALLTGLSSNRQDTMLNIT